MKYTAIQPIFATMINNPKTIDVKILVENVTRNKKRKQNRGEKKDKKIERTPFSHLHISLTISRFLFLANK